MQQKSDNVVSHYVFEAPVRIWHWLTVFQVFQAEPLLFYLVFMMNLSIL